MAIRFSRQVQTAEDLARPRYLLLQLVDFAHDLSSSTRSRYPADFPRDAKPEFNLESTDQFGNGLEEDGWASVRPEEIEGRTSASAALAALGSRKTVISDSRAYTGRRDQC
jgi:hypothetical protein